MVCSWFPVTTRGYFTSNFSHRGIGILSIDKNPISTGSSNDDQILLYQLINYNFLKSNEIPQILVIHMTSQLSGMVS